MKVLTLPNSDAHGLTVRAKALVFEDPSSRDLLNQIRRIAPSDATVLIVGETGTGKEIVARYVHELSRRASRPFVAVNCGAFSETLVDSELFGHERGAFTGAVSAKTGWFEAADGGTLFLDEIGDLPTSIQVKLLRVLQERLVVRLGSRNVTPVDIRLVAATNVDLEAAVGAGRFREDLFFRLRVAPLRLPALRERPGDILPLTEHFLRVYGQRAELQEVSLTAAAVQQLLDHPWPGNIRELENVLHRAVLTCQSGRIDAGDLSLANFRQRPPAAAQLRLGAEPRKDDTFSRVLTNFFEQGGPNMYGRIDAAVIGAAYAYCHHNQIQTARLLGISRNVLRARLAQHGMLAGRRDLHSTHDPPDATP